jgi:lysophospholipase L1-like esterase
MGSKNNYIKHLLIISLIINLLFISVFSYALTLDTVKSLITSKLTALKNVDTFVGDGHWRNTESIYANIGIPQGSNIFIGDSLIEFCPWDKLIKSTNPVINRGISGDTTAGLLQRIGTIINAKPSKVFIMIGINDILRNLDTNKSIGNYTKAIEMIQAKSPNTEIFVLSVLPVEKHSDNQVIIQFNGKLKGLSADMKFTYLDFYNDFLDVKTNQMSQSLSADKIHLNYNGVVKLASLVSQHI